MEKKDNLMVDLETLGVCADAVVTTIGAVAFSLDGSLGNEIEIYPTVQDQIPQRKVEWGALKFWFTQGDIVRYQQSEAKRDKSLKEILISFSDFCNQSLDKNFKIWGNGFDIPLLNQAYSSFDMETPWSYKRIMDCRTAVWLSKISVQKYIDEQELAHNAVSDCKFQIKFIIDAYNILRGNY